ncbi:hypothetical protein [Streptococcus anginosus]|uniref:hypothetical protein n=1 Tax=Streptococcus anginosus TaxID=1328 RepID=UPI0020018F8B|nr:hypothetical protein [Streptococcus anginosus]
METNFKILALLTVTLGLLAGCGNKDILGTSFNFKYAEVKLVDGRIIKGKVKVWAKYDKQDSIRVTFDNGEEYYTHSSNVVLYNK